VTLVANSRWRSPDGSLGNLGALAKRFPPVHRGRAEFATSVNSRVTSRHLGLLATGAPAWSRGSAVENPINRVAGEPDGPGDPGDRHAL
jgi:hypothetical protein